MNKMTPRTPTMASEFGAACPVDGDLLALVQRVRGFDYDGSTPDEHMLIVDALKTIANDTIARFEHVLTLQRELEGKLQTASFCAEVSAVVATLKPAAPRKGWWANLRG